MQYKNILSVILLSSIGTAAITACGGSGGGNNTSSPTATPAPPASTTPPTNTTPPVNTTPPASTTPPTSTTPPATTTPTPIPLANYPCDSNRYDFWSVNSATSNECGLTISRFIYEPFAYASADVPKSSNQSYSSYGEYMAAFKGSNLVGLKIGNNKPESATQNIPNDNRINNFWLEQGNIENNRTLWWGRSNFGGHYALGQESWELLERTLRSDFSKIMELGAGKISPLPKVGTVYKQVQTTAVTFAGGLGDNIRTLPTPPLLNGTVSNAQMTLGSPHARGVLTFKLTHYGSAHNITIPLLPNNTDYSSGAESYFRMKQGSMAANGSIVACKTDGKSSFSHVGNQDICDFGNPVNSSNPLRLYAARGMFFAPNSRYLAVQFQLEMNVEARNRTGAVARGLIILRSEQN